MQPWEIKQDDSRKADSLPTFIIFCEDSASEPTYFRYFETPLIKVNAIGDQKSMFTNVSQAIDYCNNQGLMEESLENGPLKLKTSEVNVWCVFDRDLNQTPPNTIHNVNFDTSIYLAETCGFNVAWSNDAFELWILLHFEEVDINDENNSSRVTYYERLTKIFENIPNPNEDLEKARRYNNFCYKMNLKSEKNFRSIVRPEIIPNTIKAIERAKALEAIHFSNLTPYHQKVPCTLVHKLVEELIRLGGKEIS